MKFTYLEKEKIYGILAITAVFYFVLPISQFFIWLLLMALLFYIFRRIPYIGDSDSQMRDGVFYSPCSGEVKRVERSVTHPIFGSGLTEIVVEKNGLSEFGLRLPANCQVHEMRFKNANNRLLGLWGSLFTSAQKSHTLGGNFLRFTNDLNLEYGIHLPNGFFGTLAKLWVSTGDRGRLGALFGWQAFASRVVLYFPDDFTILVKPGQNLKSVVSPLAGCPLLE
jgi:hypothetical protein